MWVYGLTGLGARILSAIALVGIAFNLSPIQRQSTLFGDCVQEGRQQGKTIAESVGFCNGAN